MRLSRFRRHTAVHQSLTTAFDAFTNSQNEMCLATSKESMHLNLIKRKVALQKTMFDPGPWRTLPRAPRLGTPEEMNVFL